ncbi:MAG: hypothetical protein KAS93_04465 [Gammaproteobacteria bacterium]|nr:hypothetical protein [Gammaproteobacteria bacterium]
MLTQAPKIAVIGSRGLGDGLIFLVLAKNLQRHGFDVTFYNNFTAQLKPWIPDLKLAPYPKKEDVFTHFTKFDIVISEKVSVLTDAVPENKFKELGEKYIFLSCTTRNLHPDLTLDPSAYVKNKINDDAIFTAIQPILASAGTILPKISKTLPLIETLAIFCRDKLFIPEATKEINLQPPAHLIHQKYPKRIIIHPTSSTTNKNWAQHKFIKLASRLQKDGWVPTFIVSPAERPEWQRITAGLFDLPSFPSINELAAFIYESGVMVGNESGIGHLASALGIPTLSIAGAGTKKIRWRPSWAYGEIINFPKITFKGKKYWQWFISVNHVYRCFNQFVKYLQKHRLLPQAD